MVVNTFHLSTREAIAEAGTLFEDSSNIHILERRRTAQSETGRVFSSC